MATKHQGPDQLLPATEKMTWFADQAVKLNADEKDILSDPPISVITALTRVAENHPERVALVHSQNGVKDEYTYKRYYESVIQVATVFTKLGLQENHGVAIIGSNSPQWFISYMAAIFAGGISFGIHHSYSEDVMKLLIHKAECNIVVTDDEQKVDDLLKAANSLPHLKAVIQFGGRTKTGMPNLHLWDDIMTMTVDNGEEELIKRISNIAPNKCCTLLATSGTTGEPKMVMLSHDNLTWSSKLVMKYYNGDQTFEPDVIISYQTLSHLAAIKADIYWPLMCDGGTVYIAKPNALQESLFEMIREIRPTFMICVPKVWETMMDYYVISEKSRIRKMLKSWALEKAWNKNEAFLTERNSSPINFAKNLVLKKFRAQMGLDRCRLAVVGSSACRREVLEFYTSLKVPLMEMYGLTETGAVTANLKSSFKHGSIGRPIHGVRIKFQKDPDSNENELLLAGRNVFMGYLKNEQKTRETFDDEHFMHPNDLGTLDDEDFITLSGRSIDLIINRDSRKIFPTPIELRILTQMPCLSHCVLVGEGQSFLHVLLAFKTKIDTSSGEPLDNLDDIAVEWCRSFGVTAEKLSELVDGQNPKLVSAIQHVIDRTNATASADKELIKNWKILPVGFSVKGGELGVTTKMKRQKIYEKYKTIIEELYKA